MYNTSLQYIYFTLGDWNVGMRFRDCVYQRECVDQRDQRKVRGIRGGEGESSQ
jgi:hypothetical protein